MSIRPTTLMEGDQLANASVALLQQQEGERALRDPHLPFSLPSKALREYQRAVRETIGRRRQAREVVLAEQAYQERCEIDAALREAELDADCAHAEELAEIAVPFGEMEAKARAERDAAIAAANRAYEQVVQEAARAYEREAAVVRQKRDLTLSQARALREEAIASIESRLQADKLQLEEELQLVPIEGLRHVIEDRANWSAHERGKALLALIELAGRADASVRFTSVCMEHLYSGILADCYLNAEPGAGGGKLMSAEVLEQLVALAHRSADKRPVIVKCLHDVVAQHPGVGSASFVESLAQLYVKVSTDTLSTYADDVRDNERILETMLTQIGETLKRTPRQGSRADDALPAAPLTEAADPAPSPPVVSARDWGRDSDDDPVSETHLAELIDIDELLYSDVQKAEQAPAEDTRTVEASTNRRG